MSFQLKQNIEIVKENCKKYSEKENLKKLIDARDKQKRKDTVELATAHQKEVAIAVAKEIEKQDPHKEILTRIENDGLSVGDMVFFSIEEGRQKIAEIRENIKDIEQKSLSAPLMMKKALEGQDSYNMEMSLLQKEIDTNRTIIVEIQKIFYPIEVSH